MPYHYLNTHLYISKQSFNPVIPEHVLGEKVYKSHMYFKKFITDLDDEVLEKYRLYSGVDYINRVLEEKAKTYSVIVEVHPPPPSVETTNNDNIEKTEEDNLPST